MNDATTLTIFLSLTYQAVGWVVIVVFLTSAIWGVILLFHGRGLERSMRRLLILATGLSMLEGLVGVALFVLHAPIHILSRTYLFGCIYLIVGLPVAYLSYPRSKIGQGMLLWMIFACCLMPAVTLAMILGG